MGLVYLVQLFKCLCRGFEAALHACGFYHQNKTAELCDIRFSIGNAAMYGGKVHRPSNEWEE